MRFRRLALLPLLVIAACGDDDTPAPPTTPPRFEPTGQELLSTASPTKDEDPAVLLARDGSIVVAWFSDRGGNSDIYITRAQSGTAWAAPVRVTTSVDGDFYPNLIQTDDGAFHLVWFRWYALNRGHIWYNRSSNPLSWDTANEVQVTTADNVDDWVPTIATTQDSLRVFFVSRERGGPGATNDIYYASSALGSDAWDDGRRFPHNSPFAHDHLPFAAWTGSQLDLVWVRHDTSQPVPWADPPPASEIRHSSTDDGVTWSGESLVTPGSPTVHVFPQLYRRYGGEWRIVWTTTRSGAPQVVELALAQIGSYPAALIENTAVGDGYSHRVTRTPVNGLYFGAWVQGPDGAQDIYYRFYR
ncbi:MAG TPA: hypothetical protein VF247_03505 [Candidatus Krumholzibacteria bacterium]